MQRLTSSFLLSASLCAAAAACNADRPTAVESPTTALASGVVTPAGFVTSQPAQAEALVPGASVKAIISTGDIIPGTAEAWHPIPDGLGAYLENGSLFLFANHELSSSGVKSSNGGPTIAYARVSKLEIDPLAVSVLGGSYVENGSSQLQRLCSASWVDGGEGFPSGYFLTGEESSPTASGSIVSAFSKSGVRTPLPWLGSFSHENQIAVPGFPGKVVSIGLDDTIGASELYMYVAADETAFLQGTGKLYVFKTDRKTAAGTNLHSGNMTQGQTIPGSFVEIADPADLGSPVANRFANLQAKVDALGAMPFVRIEDGDYDKNSPNTPAIYFVDTGTRGVTGRAQVNASCNGICDLAGSLYRMEFNSVDPTKGVKLKLMLRSQGASTGFASPDNIATTARSIMIQEDPAYDGFDGTRAPAIWNLQLANDGRNAVQPRKVVQTTQETLIPGPAGQCIDALGQCWETSGIISTASTLGPETWLFVVQAHTLPWLSAANGGTSSYGNEGGQLLYLKVRGS